MAATKAPAPDLASIELAARMLTAGHHVGDVLDVLGIKNRTHVRRTVIGGLERAEKRALAQASRLAELRAQVQTKKAEGNRTGVGR